MARYEICVLGTDGRIAYVVPVQADCDQQAIAAVQGEAHRHWKELWIGARLIGRYAPSGADGAA